MRIIDQVVSWLLKLRNRHFIAFDLCVLTLSPLVALELRTDGQAIWAEYGSSVVAVVAVFVAVKLAVFFPAGLYHRYWKYAGVDELAKITLACVVATVIQTLAFMFALRPSGLVTSEFPRSIPLIDGMLALIFVGGGRYIVRVAQRGQQRLYGENGSERVLIMGAGEAGLLIAREMQSNPHVKLRPVGFVDDDPDKQRMRMRGLNVLGTRHDIPRLVRDLEVKLVVITMPTVPGKEIREIARICELTGVKTKILPGMYELLDGVSVRTLRDVQVEDLLRRPPVRTDTSAVAEMVEGRCVLVTGSGGSIGSELCRQVLRFEPKVLLLMGHGENSIFQIESELRQYLADHPNVSTTIRTIIADIRDAERLDQVFAQHRPEIIYHAAAHKHVTLMEANLPEAITNNVGGTSNLLRWAHHYGVERFVMISTDKAVNPTSIMGSSKRIAELLVADIARRTGRAFVAVRFGNVLGSRGSVVQIFRRQIERGGPLTVTDAEAERYFMTIPEAVQLVLQAGAMGNGGEVFVLDMGEPVKIIDLARDLIRLSGVKEGRDIDIVVTGLRAGEKITESLFRADEAVERTSHEKIMVSRNGTSHHSGGGEFQDCIDRLVNAARTGRAAETMALVRDLVPEFSASGSERLEADDEGEMLAAASEKSAG